jgi:hypothetical protein
MLLLRTRCANHYYLIRLLSLTIMSTCWVVLLSLFLPSVIISAYNPSTYSSFDRRIRLLPCTIIGTRATIINEFPLLLAYGYRRGEDMWPPTNLEKPVQLKDSFPLGYIIPYPSIIPQEQQITEDSTTTTSSSTSNATATNSFNTEERSAIKRILRRASRLQIKRLTDRINFIPAFLSVILYLMGLVHRSDGWFVLAFSAYATFLYQWSQQPYENNSNNNRIIMPALPPQGHVPYLVSNPLGRSITDSPIYKLWIRTGWFVGLVLPLSYIAGDLLIFGGRRSLIHASSTGITEVLPTILSSSLRWCGSPIFLLCIQSFSEAVARNVLVCFFFCSCKQTRNNTLSCCLCIHLCGNIIFYVLSTNSSLVSLLSTIKGTTTPPNTYYYYL